MQLSSWIEIRAAFDILASAGICLLAVVANAQRLLTTSKYGKTKQACHNLQAEAGPDRKNYSPPSSLSIRRNPKKTTRQSVRQSIGKLPLIRNAERTWETEKLENEKWKMKNFTQNRISILSWCTPPNPCFSINSPGFCLPVLRSKDGKLVQTCPDHQQ